MSQIYAKYGNESWYPTILEYLHSRFNVIETVVNASFRYVAPNEDNEQTYSFMFTSILRDSGSVFDSTMQELIEKSGTNYDTRIHGFLKFIKDCDPDIEKRTVNLMINNKTIMPFKRSMVHDSIPRWWYAYIDSKYHDVMNYRKGNLENALNSVASLAILNFLTSLSSGRTALFNNVGIVYSANVS